MIVLFGAGNCGRSIARNLKEDFCFVDNDWSKVGTKMMGVSVMSSGEAQLLFPSATWIVSIGKPERSEVVAQLAALGVKFEMPWKYLAMVMGLPPIETMLLVRCLIGRDDKSFNEFRNQCEFRRKQDYDAQLPSDDLADIYFPDFIVKRDDERFVDCGAADGDTVAEFIKRWEKWDSIIAFEPDPANYAKMCRSEGDPEGRGRITQLGMAVSDFDGYTTFVATADYSSHLGDGEKKVRVTTLDQMCGLTSPTFIKMDIEGSELAALWGARGILKEHSPVLAICAYHKSEDLWQIPLLIHALQPNYKLFLRRYSPGTMDLVWYAVPPERIK